MQPLVDSDVLVYEVGFAGETAYEGVPPFDYVAEMLDSRVANICAMVDATSPPVMYLTGKGNFRYDIAKRTPYKERVGKKPFHYHNLKAYIKGRYDFVETVGMEADDALAIASTSNPEHTIICTRDKDLLHVPGWYYSWEVGNQASYGPTRVSCLGNLRFAPDGKSLKGEGLLFFYAQCLMGDRVDSIPGIPKVGAKKAFDCLFDCFSLEDAHNRVLGMYRHYYGENAEEELLEQGRLLHMTRERVGNRILLWNPPNVDYKDWYDIDTRAIEREVIL